MAVGLSYTKNNILAWVEEDAGVEEGAGVEEVFYTGPLLHWHPV